MKIEIGKTYQIVKGTQSDPRVDKYLGRSAEVIAPCSSGNPHLWEVKIVPPPVISDIQPYFKFFSNELVRPREELLDLI